MAKKYNKELRKQEEQINLVIRQHPEMEKHVVRTPFGTMLKPSWSKAAETLNSQVDFGKGINQYRRNSRKISSVPEHAFSFTDGEGRKVSRPNRKPKFKLEEIK